jgi:hypothetical protein
VLSLSRCPHQYRDIFVYPLCREPAYGLARSPRPDEHRRGRSSSRTALTGVAAKICTLVFAGVPAQNIVAPEMGSPSWHAHHLEQELSPLRSLAEARHGATLLASFWLWLSLFATCAGRRQPICAARAVRHARELGPEDRRTWPVDSMDGGRGVRARLCEEFSIEVRPVLEERFAIKGQKGALPSACHIARCAARLQLIHLCGCQLSAPPPLPATFRSHCPITSPPSLRGYISWPRQK